MKKRDFILKQLKHIVANGWFNQIQLEFTKDFILNHRGEFLAEYCGPTMNELLRITSKGKAFLAAEFLLQLNIIVNETYAYFKTDTSDIPELIAAGFKFNNEIYIIENKGLGLPIVYNKSKIYDIEDDIEWSTALAEWRDYLIKNIKI